MLIPAIPAADVLGAALFRRRQTETIRILIIIACLASCRRGRKAMSYTVCKVVSPLSFLLWCLGLRRRRDRSDNLLQAGGEGRTPPQRRRGRWACVIGGGGRRVLGSGDSEGEAPEQEVAESMRLAALGENGRLSAFEKLQELQQEGACCDVTLVVGGKYFKAHKCVLAAQSFPLRAMFEGAFKEGSEDVITLRDVAPSSFSLLLDFFYDRSVEVAAENVEGLLDLSARYGVSLLRRHCCAFMARSTNPSKACSLLAVADRYDCHRLRRDLLAYTLEYFPLACCGSGSDGFRNLSPALVTEVLMDDRLTAGEEGEVKVFWAAVAWLEAEQSRRRNADEVLSHVRFGLVSAKTLAEVVEAHPLIQTNAGKAFVHEAYRYQALPPESRDEFAASMAARARPRSAAGELSTSSAGAGHRDRLSSTRRERQHGDGSYLAAGLGAVGLDEEGLSSDEGETDDSSGDSRVQGVDHAGSGHGGGGISRGDSARAAPTPGAAKEVWEEDGTRESEAAGEESPRKSHATAPSPRRRSWGAGLRMYV